VPVARHFSLMLRCGVMRSAECCHAELSVFLWHCPPYLKGRVEPNYNQRQNR
jgi:hypothetical protein